MPDDAIPASPSSTASHQEPYYSNEDIEVLHSVIAAAQEQLDKSTGPKPLPAAALFKAYDDILPQHGIDPDSDSHLSALVFRVGGEQGPGTLSEKFEAILERIGIVLEFGDESVSSVRSTHSRSPSPVSPDSTRQYDHHQQESLRSLTEEKSTNPRVIVQHDPPASSVMSPVVSVRARVASPEPDHEVIVKRALRPIPDLGPVLRSLASHYQPKPDDEPSVSLHDDVDVQPRPSLAVDNVAENVDHEHQSRKTELNMDSFIALPTVRRATLASVVDRWRGAMMQQREWSETKSKPGNRVIGGQQQRDEKESNFGQHDKDSQTLTREHSTQQIPRPPIMAVQPAEPNKLITAQDVYNKDNQTLTREHSTQHLSQPLTAAVQPVESDRLSTAQGQRYKNNQTLTREHPTQHMPRSPTAAVQPAETEKLITAQGQHHKDNQTLTRQYSPQHLPRPPTTAAQPAEPDKLIPAQGQRYKDNQTLAREHSIHHVPLPSLPPLPPTTAVQPADFDKLITAQSLPPKTPVEYQSQQVKAAHRQRADVDVDAEKIEEERLHQQLLNRAARARQLYLASKVFNHWADRTAARLEREALARRHMVRFRCFRGWSQAPSARVPAVDQLRTVTAVQKLRRAVVEQEDQLSQAATTISHNHHVQNVLRVVDKWQCHRMARIARKKTEELSKQKALEIWKSRATRNDRLRQAMIRRRTDHEKCLALSSWQCQSQPACQRQQVARQACMIRSAFSHLDTWADQAELERRARDYNKQRLLKKAGDAFYQWNLMARAQAFRWRNDYQSVKRAVDKWTRRRDEDTLGRQLASDYCTKRYAHKVVDALDRVRLDEKQRARLHSRARLYIVATRVLPMMDKAVEQRQIQVKEMLRRHLMKRYTEVSAARKKRNFFSALDRWRSAAKGADEEAEIAAASRAAYEQSQIHDVLEKWRERTNEDLQLEDASKKYQRDAWLSTWSERAQEDEQREAHAWESWAVDKQRQCLKEWSISSLQHSGQAHTASRVQQKHSGERRNRAFQQWKQAMEDAGKASYEKSSRFTPMAGPSGLRSALKTLSSRRQLLREGLQDHDVATSTVDTPTRWTGLPFPMSLAQSARPMPPVREMDEESMTSSITGDLGRAELPYRGGIKARPPVRMSSTTPRAPVPIPLELNTQQLPKNKVDRLRRSAALRSMRMKAGSPTRHHTMPASAPAATDLRNEFRHSVHGIPHEGPARQLEDSRSVSFVSAGRPQPRRPAKTQMSQASINTAGPAPFQTPISQSHVQRGQAGSLRTGGMGQQRRYL